MCCYREAAAKLAINKDIILKDILSRSGIVRGRTNIYGGTLFSVNGAGAAFGAQDSSCCLAQATVYIAIAMVHHFEKNPSCRPIALAAMLAACSLHDATRLPQATHRNRQNRW
jgi:hypothetical protein